MYVSPSSISRRRIGIDADRKSPFPVLDIAVDSMLDQMLAAQANYKRK